MTDYPCGERWFGVIDRLSRPIARWGFNAVAIAYGVRAVAGLTFDEMIFAALCLPALGAYGFRGWEQIRHKEIER